MKESEKWRGCGREEPWDCFVIDDDRHVLQADVRSLATLFQMFSANLASDSTDPEETRKKTLELAEKFIQKWKR